MDELTLRFKDETFKPVVADTEVMLQRLLRNMVDKDSSFGSLTIKVDIELTPVDVPNSDPSVRGDTRQILIPKLSHKVSSVMQIKDETKGNSQYDDYELALDKKLGEYVLKPIISAQQSVFNTDYKAVDDAFSEATGIENGETVPDAAKDKGDDEEPEDVSDVFGDDPYDKNPARQGGTI